MQRIGNFISNPAFGLLRQSPIIAPIPRFCGSLCWPQWLLLAGLWGGLFAVATGQETTPATLTEFGKRYDGFRDLLAQAGFVGAEEREFVLACRQAQSRLQSDALSNWIIICLGNTTTLENLVPPDWSPRRFLLYGTSFLIASDEYSEFLRRGLFSTIEPDPLVVFPNSAQAYRGLEAMPICEVFNPNYQPLFKDVYSVVCNLPSYINRPYRFERPETMLIELPVSAHRRRDRNRRLFSARYPLMEVFGPMVGQEQTYRSGRGLVAADESIFLNEMITEGLVPGDNLRFARNIIQWLSAGRSADQLKLLLIENGQVISGNLLDAKYLTGDWREKSLLEKLAEEMQRLNEHVVAAEEDHRKTNSWNQPLLQEQEQQINRWANRLNLRSAEAGRWLSLVVTSLALSAFLALFLLNVRQRQHRALPLPTAQPAAFPTQSPLQLRTQAILQAGNYREPAIQLLHLFFSRLMPDAPWRQILPTLVSSTGDHLKPARRRQWDQLWRLATATPRPWWQRWWSSDYGQTVSLEQFQQLTQEVAQLQHLFTIGHLRCHFADQHIPVQQPITAKTNFNTNASAETGTDTETNTNPNIKNPS